jgi:hypothetical protein
MRHRRIAVVVWTLSAALASGALVASNMGFLVWRSLSGPGAGNPTGTNILALPYQRPAGLVDAGDLITDIGIGSVVNVQRYLEATNGLQVYTGRKGSGPDFPLASGECYFVRMSAPVDYLIGGSSIPGLALPLDPAGPGNSTGINFIALPYHRTAATASQVMGDIGFASVINVQRFVAATGGLQVYTGRKGSGPDFPLEPQECFFVRMSAFVAYVPSHY